MIMTVTEVHLKHGRQRNTSIGSFGVISVDAREGRPLAVRLGVVADEEHRYPVHVGDTFPVNDQTWKLDRVEDPDGSDRTVVLTRVA